jgi:hypothetical protein
MVVLDLQNAPLRTGLVVETVLEPVELPAAVRVLVPEPAVGGPRSFRRLRGDDPVAGEDPRQRGPRRRPHSLATHRGRHRQRATVPAGPFQLSTDLQRPRLQLLAGAQLHRLRDRLPGRHRRNLALGLRPGTDLVELGPGNAVLTAEPGDLSPTGPVRESDDQLTNASVDTSSHAGDPRRHPRPSIGTVHEPVRQNRQQQLSTKVETHPSTKL